MIQVTIVSPNPAIRIGLREILGNSAEISVVDEVADFDEIDLHDQETEVFLLASVSNMLELGNVDSAFLVLTDDFEDVIPLVEGQTRAWGILPFDAGQEEIAAAIQALGEGLCVGAPALVQRMLRSSIHVDLVSGNEPLESLTARETEVLQLTAQGLANKQIAISLNISEHTVKFHLSSLYTKLNVSSRTEAVRVGLSLGLISL